MSQTFTTASGFIQAIRHGTSRISVDTKVDVLKYAMRVCEGKAKQRARAYGGRSFWNDIANSIGSKLTSVDSAIVYSTHHAAHHKQTGGEVSAPGKGPMSKSVMTGQPRKFLTIPLSWCPRNKRDMDAWPRESWRVFEDKKGKWWAGVRTLEGGKMTTRILWRLVKSVTHDPYPFWVTEHDVAMAVSLAMTKFVTPKT